MHYGWGLIFAALYIVIMHLISPPIEASYIILALITGVSHGIVASTLIIVIIAENHPVEKYRSAGLSAAIAYMLSHIVFGIVVGGTVSGFVG